MSEQSDRFTNMAMQIEHNAERPFGGAAVILPPAGGGEPIEILLLDVRGDPATFWMVLQAKIKVAFDELQAAEQRGKLYGR